MIAFILTLALTCYMTGMIWSMQILEYPLLREAQDTCKNLSL